ncbi:GNAT family N-acetyltransferase [Caldalkalibacillus salinus]|uniref:GNAT family N-acetyltransferase n=1 Tax=Caldalkalibacillus salinus TaxID=2803787 RepID=UPI0019210B5A|nr:GNAT family protein [Caldalkalibacillus salinus]
MDKATASPNTTVSLDFLQSHMKAQLEGYRLSEEQLCYTSHPLEAVEKCEIDHTRHPIVIFSHSVMVGFFVLHGWYGVKDYHDNKQAMLIRAYSIDTRYQGKGIAKTSLQLLPKFVSENFPEINELILAVNENNEIAQQVYKRTGFKDKGHRVMGPKGLLHVYHMQVSDPAVY